MKNNPIHTALDTIYLTQPQKDKLRAAIAAQLPEENPQRREYHARPTPVHRFSWIPAAAVLVVVVCLSVFILGRLNEGTLEMSPSQVTQPQIPAESLQSFFESPQYLANVEWNAYLEKNYQEDPKTAQAVIDIYAHFYCQDEKMMEDLDDLCEKYGLTLMGRAEAVNDYEQLLEIVCIDTICNPIECVTQTFKNYGNGYYSDGSFVIGGETVMNYPDTPWSYPISFEFRRIMKSTFCDSLLEIGDLSRYEHWEYTTQNGTELLLAFHEDKALILADRPDSLILVTTIDNRVGDIVYGEQAMNKAALEAFAETFDFTLPPDGGLAPIPEPKAVAREELNVYMAPTPEAATVGIIPAGTQLKLIRREMVNNRKWAYVEGESAGWIELDHVELTYATKDPSPNSAGYSHVLQKYIDAINENWDMTRCEQEDISYLTTLLESTEDLGYSLIDLDGNGVEELIVTNGNVIYDLFTLLKDGSLFHLLSGADRGEYTLCENNYIAYVGFDSADWTRYYFYRVKGASLVLEQALEYNTHQGPDNPWFRSEGDNLAPVSEADFQKTIDSYGKAALEFTSITQNQ